MFERELRFFRPERLAELEEEIKLKERYKAIRGFVEKRYKGEYQKGLFSQVAKEGKRFLLSLKPEKLQEILGKEEFGIIYEMILAYDGLKKEIGRSFKIREIKEFIAQYGREMLPWSIKKAISLLAKAHYSLSEILNASAILGMEKTGKRFKKFAEAIKKEEPQETKKLNLLSLKKILADLKNESEIWQGRERFEKEKPIEIEGFEKFDYPQMKGKEIIKMALDILPQALFQNVEKISYKEREEQIREDYGIPGNSLAKFLRESCEIRFLKTKLGKGEYLRCLVPALFHELGHSLDPRLIDQRNLSPSEQFELIKDWEEIRSKEPEFSSYPSLINNKDKLLENWFKSRESWAEGFKMFLENPIYLKEVVPERYKFFSVYLKRRFPEVDLKEVSGKRRNYENILYRLERTEGLEKQS